jgi:phosphorylcholine metabolism protein LicD
MRVLEQHTGMTAHQTLLLEMLKDIDIVCKRRRISYQLFAGTALGAVRHHGFIPWDDDVDTYSKKQKNFLMQYGIYAKKPMSTVIIHYAHNHWPNSFIALKLMKNV